MQAEITYNERTSRVENSIIARLRDRLATAKTANEMFRVFSKFNALFVRPKIRGAITEYQTQLIDNVKHDISSLHERFKQQYGHSEAHAMAQLRDLPPVSGAIIWARQIERQLDWLYEKSRGTYSAMIGLFILKVKSSRAKAASSEGNWILVPSSKPGFTTCKENNSRSQVGSSTSTKSELQTMP